MEHSIRFRAVAVAGVIFLASVLVLVGSSLPASALEPIPTPEPQPGSFGLEATKTQPPPTQAARITVPGGGASFSSSPITVSGICPNTLLVEIYNNGVMAGSVICKGGSFSLQVGLFAGENKLSAIVYDDIGQAGPKSNVVTVRYSDADFTSFSDLITLTSSYGRRSAAAGSQLPWPLQLSGGTGPYAFSIDWGDGTDTELKSQSLAGVVNIAHVYKTAGIYNVNVKVADANNASAFLQLVAVANGEVSGSGSLDDSSNESAATTPTILWTPTAVSLALLPPAFWLGRQSQVVSLRNKMLKERDSEKSA